MSAAAHATRWSGVCHGCKREREIQTRIDHGARPLCDDCASRPHRLPSAIGLDVDLAGAGAASEPEATALAQRLAESRVDLVEVLERGLPPRQWLPGSEGMLVRGKRHHIAAQLKSGKTLSMLAHVVDMASAGARVAIFDRENGAEEYARRLADVLADRDSDTRSAVRERLTYYAWPQLKLDDADQLAAALAGTDLVVWDSTRTFLSSLALDEDRSDDYAKFAGALIDPLFRAGVATVLLDNSGHNNQGRARGSSSKGDLADIVYSLKVLAPFDEHRRGRLRLVRAHSRFGDVGAAFTLELGAGHFGTFTLDEAERDPGGFRPTVLMERTSRRLEETPGLSWSGLRSAVKGNNDAIDLGLELLIAEGYVRVEQDGQARRHFSTRPYREADDPRSANPAQTLPNPAQGQGPRDPAPLPPPKGQGQGRVDNGSHNPAHLPLATAEQEAQAARAADLIWEKTHDAR